MNDFKKGDFRRRQARLRAKHDKVTQDSVIATNRCMRTTSEDYSSVNQQNASYLDQAVYNQHQYPSQLYSQVLGNPNDSNSTYSNIVNYSNSMHHTTATGHLSPYHYHHPGQSNSNQQYAYVTFPWLPAAAAAAAATSANNLLETITSSALACSYNTILQPHSHSTATDLCAENNLYYNHNFHCK